MSMEWYNKAYGNLSKMSRSQNWNDMLKEWVFTGEVTEVDDEDCQLCDHTGLRWHFKIFNILTSNTLWVGSECIKHFYETRLELEDDFVVNIDNVTKLLNELVVEYINNGKKTGIEQVLKTIRLQYEEYPLTVKDGKFTIRQLKWILKLANKLKIEVNPSDFKIKLKKLNQFSQITTYHDLEQEDIIKYVVPSLTNQQLKSLNNLSKSRKNYLLMKKAELLIK